MSVLATVEMKKACALIRAKKPHDVPNPNETDAQRKQRLQPRFLEASHHAAHLKPHLVLVARAFLKEAVDTLTRVTKGSPAVFPLPGPLTVEQDAIALALSTWRVVQLWYGAHSKEAMAFKLAMHAAFNERDPRHLDSSVVCLLFMSARNSEHRSQINHRAMDLGTMARTLMFAPPTMRSWLTTESPLLGDMCLIYLLLHGTRDATILQVANDSVKHDVLFCGFLVLTWGDAILSVVDEEVYAKEKEARYLLAKREQHYATSPKSQKTLTIMTRTPHLRFYRGVDLVDTQEWMHGFGLADPMGTVPPLYL